MAKRTPVCVVDDHLGGGVDVITAGCAEGVCVGAVPGRYDQTPYPNLMNSLNLLVS